MIKHILQSTSISLTSLIAILLAFTPRAFAMNEFQRVACPNPGGTQQANFSDGFHWVVGFTQNLWGKDSLFAMGNNNFTQCFCPLPHEGQAKMIRGIQTNWISVSNLTASQQQQLIDRGWQLRHDGTVFGLSQNDFLVRNFSFSCKNVGEVSSKFALTNAESVIDSDNADVSTSVTINQQTGENVVNKNTQGNVRVVTGDVSSTVEITHNVINNLRERMRSMVERIRVHVSGNGSSSENSVVTSSD